jgi:NhaA family Na+:H+ antiporter
MVKNALRDFFKLEAAGGILLLFAAAAAMILKNSTLGGAYGDFLNVPGQIRIGALDISKPLFLWVNDGLMAVFFFMIGMEVKREVLIGELSDIRQIILPGLAGIGGIVVPALIYIIIVGDNPLLFKGWAIPTATDIAFALGILALVGNVPVAMKLFLMTLAIIDDLGAIIIIALFYTTNLSLLSLSLAGLAISGLIILKIRGVMSIAPYLLIGIVLWVSVLKSGVHATLAGVILGFFIPMGKEKDSDGRTPLERLIHELHPSVAFVILPLFAFVNGGVDLSGVTFASLMEPVPLGIMLGLLIGKQVGVFSFAWIAIKSGLTRLPQGTTMMDIYGASLLCGVGFTMSLFIGSLAFESGGAGYERPDRLGIIVGSLAAGILGFAILKLTRRNKRVNEFE